MKNTFSLLRKIILAGCLLGSYGSHAWGRPSKIIAPAHSDIVTEASDKSDKYEADIAGYTLALQWSPEYCRGKTTHAADAYQCGTGRFFSFVSDGLWGVDAAGKRLQYCKEATALPLATIDKMADVTPSAQLVQQQWTKYGACTASKAEDYFSRISTLFRKIHFPDMNRVSSDPDLTVAKLKDAFVEANRHLDSKAIKVVVNHKNWLTGIRLCYNADFKFQNCLADSVTPPADTKIKVKPGFQLRPVFG